MAKEAKTVVPPVVPAHVPAPANVEPIAQRAVETHHITTAEPTRVVAYGERGAGNANGNYKIIVDGKELYHLTFTQLLGGALVHGVTDEALLAILIDRLAGFQSGKFPHAANAKALDHLNQALEALKNRTRERLRRGVEGKLEA